MKEQHMDHTIYGVATVGPKGQIVIPVDARRRLGVQTGDKVVIVGPAHKPQFVGLCNENVFHDLIQKMDEKIATLKTEIQVKSKEKQLL